MNVLIEHIEPLPLPIRFSREVQTGKSMGFVSKQVGMSQNTILITTVCSAFSGLINLHMLLKVWSGWNISCRNDLKQGMAQFWIQAPFG